MKNGDKRNRFTQQFNPTSKNIFTLPLGGKILQGNVMASRFPGCSWELFRAPAAANCVRDLHTAD
jgi:hypothetical protein